MNGLYRLSTIFFLAIRHWVKIFIFYSGIAFIIDKAYPSKDTSPKPTIVIWLVTIYIAVYGIAVQRYERDSNRYQTELATYLSMLASENYVQGVYNVTNLLNEKRILHEPEIAKPKSIYKAFWGVRQVLPTDRIISQLEKVMSTVRGRNRKCYYISKNFSIEEFIVEEFKVGEKNTSFDQFLMFLHNDDYFFNIFSSLNPNLSRSECSLLNLNNIRVGNGQVMLKAGFNGNLISFSLDRDFENSDRNIYSPVFSYSMLNLYKRSFNDNLPFKDNGVYLFSKLTFINKKNNLTGVYRFSRLIGYGKHTELRLGIHPFEQYSFMFNKLSNIKNSCEILRDFPWNVLDDKNCEGIRTYRTYRELLISYLESKDFRLKYDRVKSDMERPNLDDVVSHLKHFDFRIFSYGEVQ